MSTAQAQRIVLGRLSAANTVLLSVHLALHEVPDWCDGVDALKRPFMLVGRWQLGDSDTAKAAVQAVIDALQAGDLPDGVVGVAYKPKASAAIAQVVAGQARHVLIDGPRSSGKTFLVPGALAVLAERHARSGHALPLKVLWLHAALNLASEKTGSTLEEAKWNGLWRLKDDRCRAILTVGGVEMVEARFVGCMDASASELLRAACHVVCCEELVRTQDDAGGISEQDYSVAVSSMIGRLPAHRHVAVSTTNPGTPEGWVYQRWIEGGGQPDHVRCAVPGNDRLSPAEIEELRATFHTNDALQKRLVEGQWVALLLGKAVAEGFNADLHVAKQRLHPILGEPLFLGVDFGLTPAVCIGQPIQESLRIYAALPCVRGGIRQHFEASVLPWIARWAPWALRDGLTFIRGGYDPSGETPEETDSDRNALATVEELVGGIWTPGPVRWPARNSCLLTALNRHVAPGQPALKLDPEDCAPLIQALNGTWHYHVDQQGHICRDLPMKPNHPAEDLGDAMIYLLSEMMAVPSHEPREVKVISSFDPRMELGGVGPRF